MFMFPYISGSLAARCLLPAAWLPFLNNYNKIIIYIIIIYFYITPNLRLNSLSHTTVLSLFVVVVSCVCCCVGDLR